MDKEIRKRYEKLLSKLISNDRLYHSQCVAEEAVRLAKQYGADLEKAELAGLLHDILKTSKEAQKEILLKMNPLPTTLELLTPKLWHAMAGSEYLRTQLEITDEDVINAVRYHTTARGGMSLLEKIIYLADFTSADRSYSGVKQMREAVDSSLRKGLEIALKFTIEELLEANLPIHPDTINAYNELFLF
ncbi:MAG: bis(5'-nucleosyl)-tetraphosphatase (symmetrical) YqeK [Oscillospiraceae bacterium]|jgi:nicotinate-nucleotide adenylyltransferase|nr:bis(5'-nucleosyl)-tetraphosphatase (symmetrical) YqeK [Oscillospiraceae bacterium]